MQATNKKATMARVEDQDGWRWYERDGKSYISVTQSLSHVVPQRLQNYFKKYSENKHKKTLQVTGNIGVEIENLIYADLMDQPMELKPEYEQPFENWLRIKKENDITVTNIHRIVWSDLYGFAGELDIEGTFRGKPAIMDIKSGWVGVKAGQQQAAYAQAVQEVNGEEVDYQLVTLPIHRDGSFKEPLVVKHYDFVLSHYLYTLETFKSTYFYKLQKMGYPWLKKDAAETYWYDQFYGREE